MTGSEKLEVPVSTANNNQPESISMNAFKQPKAFYLIFSIELWERFGYYGLQGIMAVYLVKMLGMSEADSITLFSSFSALVYGFVAIGGWLGDKVLGAKRVIVLGALTLAVGYSMIAYSGHEIFWVYLAWQPLPLVMAYLKPTLHLYFQPATARTIRVWTVHLPCTICPSISVRSSLCWQPHGWRLNMAGALRFL